MSFAKFTWGIMNPITTKGKTMNTKIKIAAAITAISGIAVFAGLVSFAGSTIALQERFPHLDYDVVLAAHKVMIWKTLKGEFENYDTNDEAVLDQLFLLEVDRLTSS